MKLKRKQQLMLLPAIIKTPCCMALKSPKIAHVMTASWLAIPTKDFNTTNRVFLRVLMLLWLQDFMDLPS